MGETEENVGVRGVQVGATTPLSARTCLYLNIELNRNI